MNTLKHSLKIRLACLALVAIDCLTLALYPSPLSALLVWLCGSVALVVAIAPVRSKFSI